MPNQPSRDAILDDVRRNRAALVQSSGGTLDALYAHLKACEREHAGTLIKPPPPDDGTEEPRTPPKPRG
jgi:hypothetical protein